MLRCAAAALLVWAALGCVTQTVLRDGQRLELDAAAALDLQRARAAVDAGDYEAAARLLQSFEFELAGSRLADRGHFLRGQVFAELGRGEEAAAAWQRVVTDHPRSPLNPDAALRAAGAYRDLGRIELGRRVLRDAAWRRADDELRARIHRMRADLAREVGDYADAAVALAYSRRDVADAASLAELDRELGELLSDRLTELQLEELLDELPGGPVRDRVNLVIARRALSRSDYEAAQAALARLPRRLRPEDEAERLRLRARLERGAEPAVEAIGLALPLSGPYSGFGQAALRAVALALGLYDDPRARFRVLVADTRGDVERAPPAVADLIERGASAIIGPLRSPVAAAAAPVAENGGVPLLTLARRRDVPYLGDFVFRIGVSAEDEVRALVTHFAQIERFRRFAVLYPDDPFGREYKNAYWDEVEAAGAQMVGAEPYQPGTVDWQEPIQKLVGLHPAYLTDEQKELLRERDGLLRRPSDDENAARLAEPEIRDLPPYIDFDVLFVPDVAEKVGLILPQLRFFDIEDVAFSGPSSWNDPKLIEIAGARANGVVFTSAFCAQTELPHVSAFVERHNAAYGAAPDDIAARAFDAAGVLARHVLGGGLSREQLRRRLIDTAAFEGVSGLSGFDDKGDSIHSMCLLSVRRGSIHPFERLP